MISNCLNPVCRVPFSHVHDGRIFSVDGSLLHAENRGLPHQNQQYWLCGTCSRSLKVVVENGRITTAPIEVETASLAG